MLVSFSGKASKGAGGRNHCRGWGLDLYPAQGQEPDRVGWEGTEQEQRP